MKPDETVPPMPEHPQQAGTDETCDEGVPALGADALETLGRERDEARDKMLRALAELENYRNRANRERLEERKYASIELLRDLLPIWDNMNRALEAAEQTHNLDALIEGIKMVESQFVTVLAQHGCLKIEALGQTFDPNFHASIAQQPSSEYEPNSVMYESQAGFKLHDRIVRPSQVVLAAPVPPSET